MSGWGDLFPEIHKDTKPVISLGFVINSFNFYTDYKNVGGGITKLQSGFLSEFTVAVKILNTSNHLIPFDKTIKTRYYTEKSGNYSTILFQERDFKLYIDQALAKFVTELVADPDFKKVIEGVNTKASYPSNYEKITIAKTAIKADRPAVMKSALDASVTIVTGGSLGSGVVISKDGLLLTCSHVVGGNESTEVILSNKVQLKANVLRNLPTYDVALLQLEGASANPLPLGSIDRVEIGEEVWVIGTPSDTEFGQSVSKGILSGKRIMEEKSYLQTDASISLGNSGGPLINEKGEILGIVNAKIISRGIEGVGFAIPIDVALEKLGVVVEK